MSKVGGCGFWRLDFGIWDLALYVGYFSSPVKMET
jgi:hypothetical protein